MGDDDGVEVGAPGACLVGEAVVLGVKSESVGDDDGVEVGAPGACLVGEAVGPMLVLGATLGFSDGWVSQDTPHVLGHRARSSWIC